jgi:spore maturation protein CgeB
MNKPRIILNFRKGFAPLREAFETLGYVVSDNVWEPQAALLAETAACVVNLYEGARAPWQTLMLKRRLKATGVPLIGIDRDAPWHMGLRRRRMWIFSKLKLLDLYATHTLQPTWRLAPHVHYHANAVWKRNFNLHGRTLAEMREPEFFRYDVSFVGNLDGVRYREHAQRQRFLAELEDRLKPFGLRILFRHSEGIPESEQIEIIQRSIINLTYRSSCDHGGTISWGLPERCYGVPARGGFVLSDHRRHAANDFDLKHEWAEYNELDDCVSKIRFYLAHFPQTRQIAEAAHARVMAQHTYEHRVAKLMDVVASLRSVTADGGGNDLDRSSVRDKNGRS